MVTRNTHVKCQSLKGVEISNGLSARGQWFYDRASKLLDVVARLACGNMRKTLLILALSVVNNSFVTPHTPFKYYHISLLHVCGKKSMWVKLTEMTNKL
jgi:hypothetical protein